MISSREQAPRGLLRLSFVQTPALALIPATLATLAAQAPELRVEVSQLETLDALDARRSRSVDLAVGVEYDPIPAPRHRDVDRVDLLREDVLLAVRARRGVVDGTPLSLADLADRPWAAGKLGSGHNAAVHYECNRLGGYAPDVRHRTDDGLIRRALVSSGQAVTLLPALIGSATPQVTVHPPRARSAAPCSPRRALPERSCPRCARRAGRCTRRPSPRRRATRAWRRLRNRPTGARPAVPSR